MKTDLGVVQVGSGNKVEVDIPRECEDIDKRYDNARKILKEPREEEQKRDASTKQEDYYRRFRTRVVLVWLITNLALIVAILHSNVGLEEINVRASESRANVYVTVSMIPVQYWLTIVMWSVAALAFFRFSGAMLYLIFRLFQR